MKGAVRAKVFLGSVILALISLSVIYLIDNPGMKRPVSPVKKDVKTDQTEVLVDGFRYSKRVDDKSNWELIARKAAMKKDTGKARLEDLDATFNEKDGTVITLKADRGTFDSNAKTATVMKKDNVVRVTSNKGYTLTANELNWDGEKKELETDDRVTLTGKNIKVEGRGMKARIDLQEVRITDGVKTTFTQSP